MRRRRNTGPSLSMYRSRHRQGFDMEMESGACTAAAKEHQIIPVDHFIMVLVP